MTRRALPVERAVLTVDELAVVLGVGRNTVYELERTHELPVPSIRLGRLILFPRAAVQALLHDRRASEGAVPTEAASDLAELKRTVQHVVGDCQRILDECSAVLARISMDNRDNQTASWSSDVWKR